MHKDNINWVSFNFLLVHYYKKQFLILPHPEVQNYIDKKSSNYNKWISGMARLKQKIKDNK